ncbi:MAG: Fic family protein [Nitrospinales bacterium]
MKPFEPNCLPLDCIDWGAHVTLVGRANAALARYDGMLQGVVNPAVLLSPMTTQEAVLSSRIEGTQASMEEVLEYEAGSTEKIIPEKHADIQEIINYRHAMAVAKAQFEIIHPFLDGNGRLGRMLIPLFLYAKRLLSSPMFYMSAYLEEHRDVYYERLQAISKNGDWNGWITFFLSALTEQAAQNTETTKAIIDLYERLKKQVVDATHSQFAVQALDAIFSRPVFRSSQFQQLANIKTRSTAARILRKLREVGVLKVLKEGKGRRSALIMFPELIYLVEGKRVL